MPCARTSRRQVLPLALALLSLAAVPTGDLGGFFSRDTATTRDPEYLATFPLPPELGGAYEFWNRVYSEWSSSQAFLHRDRSFELEKSELGAVKLYDTSSDFVQRYSNINSKQAARKKGQLEYWRMQRGKRDQLLTAMQTYYYFRDAMELAGAETGAPRELLALGFLESLYTYDARSYTGATGVFQIQPWEAYKLGAIMDPAFNQLLDPVSSARLAMKKLVHDEQLLRQHIKAQGLAEPESLWPLVLSGYNQGIYAMTKAVTERRTADYMALVIGDTELRFGFAGRNFYVQFRLFADLLRNSRAALDRSGWPQMEPGVSITLGRYVLWPELVKVCRLNPGEMKAMNLAVTDLGWEGILRLPPEAEVRFPRLALEQMNQCLRGPGRKAMFETQVELAHYKVRRGENLTAIAGRLGCSPFDLMQVNGIDRDAAARLQIGQLVKVPTRRYAELAQLAEEWRGKGRPAPRAFFPYKVRRGDTVAKLQTKFGLKHPELAKWNRVEPLQIGQLLHIPQYD